MIKRSNFIIVFILLAIAGLYTNLHSDITVPTNKPLAEFPLNNQGWRMLSRSEFSAEVLNVLKATDYLSRQYAGPVVPPPWAGRRSAWRDPYSMVSIWAIC
jgi:hypothetical protein